MKCRYRNAKEAAAAGSEDPEPKLLPFIIIMCSITGWRTQTYETTTTIETSRMIGIFIERKFFQSHIPMRSVQWLRSDLVAEANVSEFRGRNFLSLITRHFSTHLSSIVRRNVLPLLLRSQTSLSHSLKNEVSALIFEDRSIRDKSKTLVSKTETAVGRAERSTR